MAGTFPISDDCAPSTKDLMSASSSCAKEVLRVVADVYDFAEEAMLSNETEIRGVIKSLRRSISGMVSQSNKEFRALGDYVYSAVANMLADSGATLQLIKSIVEQASGPYVPPPMPEPQAPSDTVTVLGQIDGRGGLDTVIPLVVPGCPAKIELHLHITVMPAQVRFPPPMPEPEPIAPQVVPDESGSRGGAQEFVIPISTVSDIPETELSEAEYVGVEEEDW